MLVFYKSLYDVYEYAVKLLQSAVVINSNVFLYCKKCLSL